MGDNPDPEFFAKLGNKVKSFVRVCHMWSKNDKSFKEPTQVGKRLNTNRASTPEGKFMDLPSIQFNEATSSIGASH
jgi:hypothetical protein